MIFCAKLDIIYENTSCFNDYFNLAPHFVSDYLNGHDKYSFKIEKFKVFVHVIEKT